MNQNGKYRFLQELFESMHIVIGYNFEHKKTPATLWKIAQRC